MQAFEELIVWKRARLVVADIYRLTQNFTRHELYGLTAQLRRAAVSVPANLAEGCKRSSKEDFARHVAIARGSAAEIDCLLYLATDLGYLEVAGVVAVRRDLDEIQRMCTALWKSLRGTN